MQTHFENSRKLREHISELTGGRCIISFSRGKDSIAAWLACREQFDKITAYYLQQVPGQLLDIERESLDYYKEWFGCEIKTMLHPGVWSMLTKYQVLQPPDRVEWLCTYPVVQYKYEDVYSWARCDNPGAYVGVGVRSADSPLRMISIRKHGPVKHKVLQFFPIYDWRSDDIERSISDAGIKLPADYHLFGRSLDGFDFRFMAPLKQHYPQDYEVVQHWFPFVGADLVRHELYGG
jgi:3'-phosphoadenosine 5'-phosphosulfate sulfotransferase (PAPS reductase)/FAD synthetase